MLSAAFQFSDPWLSQHCCQPHGCCCKSCRSRWDRSCIRYGTALQRRFRSPYLGTSVDLGFTLRALFGYLSLVSLALITSVLTRNRERAEVILYTLCAITTFIAIELLLFRDLTILKTGQYDRRPDLVSRGYRRVWCNTKCIRLSRGRAL
jgi:hypothetical protein